MRNTRNILYKRSG